MAVKLTITSTAEDDVDLAYRWYEGQRAGLGAQFIQRFRACVERIVKSPEMHEIVSGNVRRTILHRFPYAVFYELTNDQVTILRGPSYLARLDRLAISLPIVNSPRTSGWKA